MIQSHLQRPPQPEEQGAGTAQFATAALQHQAQHPLIRWRHQQRLNHLQILTDLLQATHQKPLAKTHGRAGGGGLRSRGFQLHDPSTADQGLDGGLHLGEVGVLQQSRGRQGQQLITAGLERCRQQQQQWRWLPTVLEVEHLLLKRTEGGNRIDRPNHDRWLPCALTRAQHDLPAGVLCGQLQCQ